ncbi:hypothetical protein [Cupriavidus sp. H39]|uniref:hypothetical protein n=1 Tax=Cupriavidus sp. H39 TaxID=3401635 RepID=UPI003D04D543
MSVFSIARFPRIPLSLSIDGASSILRIGKRALHICPDYVERARIPRMFEAYAGEEKGSWELLILRRWLVSASLEA